MTAETEARSSPLEGRDLQNRLSAGGVRVREVVFEGKISLRGEGASFHAATEKALSLKLPVIASTAAYGKAVSALWLGPDEWLIIVPDAERQTILDSLQKALSGQHAAVVDVSAARIVIELEGEKARTLLEKGCLLDLHPRTFKPGQCLSTIIAKTNVVIEQTRQDPLTYRLYLRPSFARHFAAWMSEAARNLME